MVVAEDLGPKKTCVWCRFWNPRTKQCSRSNYVGDPKKESCEEWRYCA